MLSNVYIANDFFLSLFILYTIRLWGDHGQAALESAQICLVNATATGTEILKNLILPGIGSFSIVDGNRVSGEDVGNK